MKEARLIYQFTESQASGKHEVKSEKPNQQVFQNIDRQKNKN